MINIYVELIDFLGVPWYLFFFNFMFMLFKILVIAVYHWFQPQEHNNILC